MKGEFVGKLKSDDDASNDDSDDGDDDHNNNGDVDSDGFQLMCLQTTFCHVCEYYCRRMELHWRVGKVIELYFWSNMSGLELKSPLVLLYSPIIV